MVDGKKRKSYTEQNTATCSKVVLLSSRGDTDSECDKAATSVVREASLPKRWKSAKIVVISQLAVALDRTKVTDRPAAYV